MSRVVAMTPGGIAAKVARIVLGHRIHVDVAIPVVSIGARGIIEERVVRGWHEATSARSLTHAVAEAALKMLINICDCSREYFSSMAYSSIGGNIRRTVGRVSMAERTVEAEGRHRGMAAYATHANTTIQFHTMAEGACLLNTPRGVMEGVVRAGPFRRMGIVNTMTALAALIAGTGYTDIKTRIAARPAWLAMALLAFCQVPLGIGAMDGA